MTSGVSTYGMAQTQLNYLSKLLQQSDTLQEQAGTGQVSQTYSGLGSEALPDLQDNAQLTSLTNYDTSITNGQTQLSVMSAASSQIQSEATSLSSALQGVTQEGNPDMSQFKQLSQNALSVVENLLNEQNGTNYVFAGGDSGTAPVGNTDSMTSYINTQISNWTSGKITTDQLVSSFTDSSQLTDTTAGYSAALSSGNAGTVAIKADDNSEVGYTTLANDPSFKKILTAAAMMVGLLNSIGSVNSTYTTDATTGTTTKSDTAGVTTPPGTTANEQSGNYFKVLNAVINQLNDGATGVTDLTASLGYAQSSLKTIQSNHTTDETTLQSSIGSIQNVDMSTVATQLSSLQTQLEAAYEMTASMRQYSLVNYLTSS